jgi:uncharacterized membrane protein YhiD involved in acid resistance
MEIGIHIMVGIIMLSLLSILFILVGVLLKLDRDKINNQSPPQVISSDRNLSELIKMMKEEKEMKAMTERDKELSDYAKNKMKNQPSGNIRTSIGGEEKPINARTKGELVQYGMSQMERDILEEFYK